MIVYLVKHLLAVSSPPVADAAVAVEDGVIAAAGRRREVLKAAGSSAEVRDLGDVIIMPGLVNTHVHLELSWLAEDRPPTGDYVKWLEGLLARKDAGVEEPARAAAKAALDSMVARGTVAIGEVANGTWTAGLIARSPLYGFVFHEIYGLRASDVETLLDDAAGRLDTIEADPEFKGAKGRLNVGLTPHAAHTCSIPLLKALTGRSAAAEEPLSIHLAESEAETQLLQDGSGPLPALYRQRGFWDESWKATGMSPVDHLDRLGALSPRTLVVHAVHLSQQDASRLQARRVTVVTCPRSNRNLGVGRANVPKLLNMGIPVALGTDSLASVEDLDLFAEMAALREEHPGLTPAAVLRMGTLNGAKALGFGSKLGTVEPGRLASLVVVPCEPEDEPLELVTSDPEEAMPLESAPWEAHAS
jgi:aminodeoxyfutalosine deaminase